MSIAAAAARDPERGPLLKELMCDPARVDASNGIFTKIEEMAKSGLIRPAVATQAHEIRHMGNGAAHGDLSDPISAEDGDEVLHLIGEVLNEVWQSLAKAERLADARRAKRQP